MVGSRKRYIHQSRRNRARRPGAARGVTSGETASLFAPVAERRSPGSACVIVALLVVPSRVPVLEHPGSQIDLGILLDRLDGTVRSEEHTSELQSRGHIVCRLLLEK